MGFGDPVHWTHLSLSHVERSVSQRPKIITGLLYIPIMGARAAGFGSPVHWTHLSLFHVERSVPQGPKERGSYPTGRNLL